MSHHGSGTPFESTIQTSYEWLDEVMEELELTDRHRAYQALRVVLHTLRDRLTVQEVADLGAQLPMLLRGVYYEGWRPAQRVRKDRKKEEFLAHVAAAFEKSPEIYPEGVVWAVFKVLSRHVSRGEIEDVLHVLPESLREFWPVVQHQ